MTVMKTIRLRLSKALLAGIDRALVKHHYSSRTEFILDAIKSKLSDLADG